VLSTEVTEEDIKNGIQDEFGVMYSKDGERLLKATQNLSGHYMIKEGTKVICNAAFSECEYLTSINIPASVTSIGYAAFYECDSLTSINIPDSVIKMEGNPFVGWKGSLNIESKSFIYENNVLFNADKTIIIAYRADDKSYNVPDTVTSIGNSAFPMCDSLTSINIPDSVITMEGNPFAGWHGSLSIESKSFIYENQVLFNADKTIIIAYRADDELYNIPNTVTNIGNSAFSWCKSLTSINIPDSMTSIGNLAFYK